MWKIPKRYSLGLLFALTLMQALVAASELPNPTGPYVTGVHDFEFVDGVYPSDRRGDEDGRRIMARAWYPACPKTNFKDVAACMTNGQAVPFSRRRLFYEPGEYEAIALPQAQFLKPLYDSEPLHALFNQTLTHSYVDAPPWKQNEDAKMSKTSDRQDTFPVIVFSHGGVSYVSQNTALMEEIASHGYLVVSTTHPGWSSGIMYPNGDTIRVDPDYEAAVWNYTLTMDDGIADPNITLRFSARKRRLENMAYGLAKYVPRGRDDMIAQLDYLQSVDPEQDSILAALVPKDKFQAVYLGMSYGGCVVASAAQVDERVIGVFNIDGTHHFYDLLDTKIRVPFVTVASEWLEEGLFYYSNEFVFEPLVSMGRDPDVSRIHLVNITHFELSDLAFAPRENRMVIPGAGGSLEGSVIHELLVQVTMTFIESLKEGESWSPTTTLDRFPGFTQALDVTYVAEWALGYFGDADEAATHDGPIETGIHDLTSSTGSSMPSKMFFFVAGLLIMMTTAY